MAGTPLPVPPGRDSSELVARAIAEVRGSNAVTIGWLRVAVRASLLAVWAVALHRADTGGPLDAQVGLVNNAIALVLAGGVLVALRRRPTRPVIAVGAASDFVFTGIAAWVAVARPTGGALSATLFVVAFQVILLWASQTLHRVAIVPLAVATVLYEGALAWRGGLSPSVTAVLVTLFSAFAASVVIIGDRLVELAVRAALEARAGELSRRHAEEMERAKLQLEAARAETEALSTLIVHDLRNPLASIMANLDLLRREVSEAQPLAREALGIASAEVDRLAAMAGDLLLVSRLEQGLQPTRTPLDVPALLQEVARAMGPVVASSGATLAVHADGVGEAWLDPSLVRRLLENLVVNAAGHVKLGDRVELAAEADGPRVLLAVRNSGPPVPAEARPHLFDKGFTRNRRAWHHAGLGLHLCRLVAERHGGKIALVERAGWNVSFEAELSAAAPAAEAAERALADAPRATG
jgi:signal transduction histidine kinase